MVQGVVLFLDSAVTRYWMGRFLGREGLAVHTTCAASLALVTLLFLGLSTGCNVLVARSVGAKDGRGLSITMGAGVVCAFAWIVVVGVFVPFAGPISGSLAEGGVSV